MIAIAEQGQTAVNAEPKATKKPRRGAQRANVAPRKAKLGKAASSKKKTPKGEKQAEGTQNGSKASQILELLKRGEGASLKELMNETGWQAHSVRGFLSGTLRKKMALRSHRRRRMLASASIRLNSES